MYRLCPALYLVAPEADAGSVVGTAMKAGKYKRLLKSSLRILLCWIARHTRTPFQLLDSPAKVRLCLIGHAMGVRSYLDYDCDYDCDCDCNCDCDCDCDCDCAWAFDCDCGCDCDCAIVTVAVTATVLL